MLTDPVLLFNKTPFLRFSVSNLVNESKLKTTLCLDDITIFTYAVSRLLGIIAKDLPKAELSYLAYLSSICCSLLLAPPGRLALLKTMHTKQN